MLISGAKSLRQRFYITITAARWCSWPGMGVNHIMVLGNVIWHQTQGEAASGSARDREFLRATLLRSAAPRNMQQRGALKWIRCVLLPLRGCGEGRLADLEPRWRLGLKTTSEKIEVAKGASGSNRAGPQHAANGLRWQIGVFDGLPEC